MAADPLPLSVASEVGSGADADTSGVAGASTDVETSGAGGTGAGVDWAVEQPTNNKAPTETIVAPVPRYVTMFSLWADSALKVPRHGGPLERSGVGPAVDPAVDEGDVVVVVVGATPQVGAFLHGIADEFLQTLVPEAFRDLMLCPALP